MTREEYDKILYYTRDIESFKTKYPTYIYLHGMVRGADIPADSNESTVSGNGPTTYHAYVIDTEVRGSEPLKYILTNPKHPALVDTINTTNYEEALKFMDKWH